MSESNRYELARRLANNLEIEDGITDARVWLRDGDSAVYWPVISPSVTRAEQITESTAEELQARGALGLGPDLQPTLGYVEIPEWKTMHSERQKTIADRIERTAQAIAGADAIAGATSALPQRIIIADEDAALRKALRAVLRNSGYQVIEAVNGREAIEKTRDEVPDLLLLAWLLPEVNGKDAAAELKTDVRTRHIPIVMLTKVTAMEDKIAALDAGVQDFITKPFDFRELLARIEQQVRWRKLLDRDGEPSASVAVEPKVEEEPVVPQLESWKGLLERKDYQGVLTGAMQVAEQSERAGDYETAAQAYVLASKGAEGTRRPDVANQLQRLAGTMYLRLAENSTDTAKIQLGYTMSAKMFLTAGNLQLAQQATEKLET